MLKPEEIKSKLMLAKISQAELAQKFGISRSQLSTIINLGGHVTKKLTEVLGENPFDLASKDKKSKD